MLSETMPAGASRLRTKLFDVDSASLHVSDYTDVHLADKLADLDRFLGLYSRVLASALDHLPVSIEDLVLVDYGGGTGLMSLLAKELGVGTVIYNDIYDVSCSDMDVLSEALGLEPDLILCGDLDALAAQLRDEGLSIDAMVSYDVLEHIYDVETHLHNLGSLSDRSFRAVYASSANPKNPRIVSALEALHWEAEHEDRSSTLASAERGTSRSYLQVRREIIESAAPDLSESEVDGLARQTRGLVADDIQAVVAEYRRTGSLGHRPAHPTNTSDPYTGDWRERLLRPKRLVEIAREVGYDAQIHAGTYPVTGTITMKILKRITNAVIHALGTSALFVAPYYVLDIRIPAAEQRTGVESLRRTSPSH